MAGRKWDDSKSMAKKALIRERIHPQVIRHTFATTLWDKGVDLKTVQSLMGHLWATIEREPKVTGMAPCELS